MAIAVDTYVLITLINDAEAHGYNRQIDLSQLNLDPDGWHTIGSILMHEEIAGAKANPDDWQVRCQVFMKFVDTMQPQMAMLDINIGIWNKMNDVAKIRQQEDTEAYGGYLTLHSMDPLVMEMFRPANNKRSK